MTLPYLFLPFNENLLSHGLKSSFELIHYGVVEASPPHTVSIFPFDERKPFEY